MPTKKAKTSQALAVIDKGELTYTEKSDLSKREAVDALMRGGVEDFDSGVTRIASGAKEIVQGCNDIREAGRKFEEAEKTGQFEFKSWASDIEGWKLETMRRIKVKAAIKVYHTLEQPAKNLEECQPVLHAAFLISGQLEQVRRLGETAHEPLNPFNAFINGASALENWLKKLESNSGETELPIEQFYANWNEEDLMKVELATRPIAERHEIAARLLKEKRQ